MKETDALRQLLIEFFEIPPNTALEDLAQQSIGKWDSFAMVQLITELQSAFSVEFDLDEIDKLTSYSQIREALMRKGLLL
jgi:acyl carrier protein